ncbi:hypothetical protein AB0C07_14945 [Actinoplanes missouriensis]|uniref:hypothetical protein n=1 Tax=Actinoplanes missouriensis TaxID=1866 RepID=UPI00340A9462
MASAVLACALAAATATPVMAAAPALRGELLPVPAGTDRQTSVRAVDVSPSGVVAGNALDSASSTELPLRWAPAGPAGWWRQRLALPAGATSGHVSGLTDAGEAAGSVTLGDTRAVRWSRDGRSSTLLSAEPSAVTAVGPDGPWAVATVDPAIPIGGEAELVSRDGARTPVRGTPELDNGYRRTVGSVGGPVTALVWVGDGIGQGATTSPVLWRAGGSVRLPVVGSYFLGPACVSRVQADGSVVYSGYQSSGGTVAWVLARHAGGVPGAEVTLSRATAAGQPTAGLTCAAGDGGTDALAADGGIAGYVSDADGRRAAFWDAAGERTVVPLAAGEQSASGVAVATGGRMAVLADLGDGAAALSLWDDGVRTRLSAPAGWTVTAVVELTDAGLLVADVRNAAGVVRPAVWNLAGRG